MFKTTFLIAAIVSSPVYAHTWRAECSQSAGQRYVMVANGGMYQPLTNPHIRIVKVEKELFKPWTDTQRAGICTLTDGQPGDVHLDTVIR